MANLKPPFAGRSRNTITVGTYPKAFDVKNVQDAIDIITGGGTSQGGTPAYDNRYEIVIAQEIHQIATGGIQVPSWTTIRGEDRYGSILHRTDSDVGPTVIIGSSSMPAEGANIVDCNVIRTGGTLDGIWIGNNENTNTPLWTECEVRGCIVQGERDGIQIDGVTATAATAVPSGRLIGNRIIGTRRTGSCDENVDLTMWGNQFILDTRGNDWLPPAATNLARANWGMFGSAFGAPLPDAQVTSHGDIYWQWIEQGLAGGSLARGWGGIFWESNVASVIIPTSITKATFNMTMNQASAAWNDRCGALMLRRGIEVPAGSLKLSNSSVEIVQTDQGPGTYDICGACYAASTNANGVVVRLENVNVTCRDLVAVSTTELRACRADAANNEIQYALTGEGVNVASGRFDLVADSPGGGTLTPISPVA